MARKQEDSLATYRQRRDTSRSKEPMKNIIPSGKGPIFVIQKHNASHLHYDVRLEIDGVLTLWAVPKGPSTNPQEKRLAVMTEDHPMGYAHFEGSNSRG